MAKARSPLPDSDVPPINPYDAVTVISLTVNGGFRTSAETDLVARAAAGDASAFHALVERHRPMVYRMAYQFVGNHHDAEDGWRFKNASVKRRCMELTEKRTLSARKMPGEISVLGLSVNG